MLDDSVTSYYIMYYLDYFTQKMVFTSKLTYSLLFISILINQSINHPINHPINHSFRCKIIGPKFEAIAEITPEAAFYKVDVDEASDVAGACGISAMPTFQFYKGGEKIDELCGADESKLKKLVLKHKVDIIIACCLLQ